MRGGWEFWVIVSYANFNELKNSQQQKENEEEVEWENAEEEIFFSL